MKKSKVKSESQEQKVFVMKLRWLWPDLVFMAIPNGGKRSQGEARHMVLEGVEKGTPDIFIAEPREKFNGLFIEMKRSDGGVVSDEQEEKLNLLVSKGYAVAICHGATEAIRALTSYLDKNQLYLDYSFGVFQSR